jgi:hypothetical protein
VATDALNNPAIRSARIERAWAAYDGDAPKALKVGRRGEDDNVSTGLARAYVDHYTAALFGRDFRIEESDAGEQTPAETALAGLWPTHDRQITMLRARTQGGVTGYAALRVLPDRVIVIDSASLSITTDPIDIERPLRYTIENEFIDESGKSARLKQTHIRMDSEGTTTGWEIIDELATSGQKYREIGRSVWPFEQSQIVHAQNRVSTYAWGEADLTPEVLDLVSAIDRTASNASKVARIYASPIVYTRGLDGVSRRAFEGRDPGSVIHFADAEQAVGHDEFGTAGTTSALALYDKLVAQFHRQTGIVDVQTADGSVGAASGVALALRYRTFIARAEELQRTYGRMIVDAAARLLIFNGVAPDSVPDLHVVWPPLLPSDENADIARAKELKDLGASNETVLRTAGLDPAIETARLEAERPADIGALLERLNTPAAPIQG